MRVLVTGHKGFIGSHLFRHYQDAGHSVFGFDIRGTRSIDAADFFRVSEMYFDLAFHCAAAIPNTDERAKNALPVASNLALDSLYFSWMMRVRPAQAVYFSSSAAYPIHLNVRGHALTEDDIDLSNISHPDSMYGMTKLVGELQAREVQAHGQYVLVVRPQSGYGHDQSLNYPFPALIHRAKRREDPFRVWGSGKQARDFIHVDDIVGAVATMLEAGAVGPFNLGTGRPTPMGELAAMIAVAAHSWNPTIAYDLTKPEGARFRYASTDRMREFYTPRVSLEEGIARALAI